MGVDGRQLGPGFDPGEGAVERGAVDLSLKVVAQSLLILRRPSHADPAFLARGPAASSGWIVRAPRARPHGDACH